ncbi:integral memnbrane protein [Campylobacter vulpis]|uniref:Integral memnbrane protein n=1 Tax=Campylobacter vulpis TaxID=1655500 RepID=A0A2G4R7I5_9BACT|nr:integral memnbrane protein [Campylobacter vulpis]MBS4275065.1 integral memnbrane protein [Campylobacter vulpis]MBS4306094.1 integral memnbrane protein [Campylobacter vulpis]MBS4313266.1 integral memnbrane protein [Campylobacter vulpis]MBS4329252.1 integral memnbrane protein [Campylobacter vulpis]MBS4330830.1 integral memnbrane protein [Campylobacter vulpis]
MKLSLGAPFLVVELIACAVFIIAFGFGNFLIFMLLSMIAGVVLLALFWRNMLSFQMGGFKDTLKQFAFVIAGFLFLIPGVLSSVFGILVLVFGLVFQAKVQANFYKKEPKKHSEEIIDVEIIEDRK